MPGTRVVHRSRPTLPMKSSTKSKVEGAARRVSGKVKEKTAQQTKNPRMESEGRNEQARGKLQTKVGRLKKALGN